MDQHDRYRACMAMTALTPDQEFLARVAYEDGCVSLRQRANWEAFSLEDRIRLYRVYFWETFDDPEEMDRLVAHHRARVTRYPDPYERYQMERGGRP